MNSLVSMKEDELYISHRIIAREVFEFNSKKTKTEEQQLTVKTTQIKELISDNLKDFEFFGGFGLKPRP